MLLLNTQLFVAIATIGHLASWRRHMDIVYTPVFIESIRNQLKSTSSWNHGAKLL